MCHIIMIRMCGGCIIGYKFTISGAQIRTQPLSLLQELLCAAAGPLGGMSLVLLADVFPRLAFCAGVHSVYNLLPIHPLDGGRLLRCTALLLLPERMAEMFCAAVEKLCLVGIGILGLWGTFILKLGITPIIIAAVMLVGMWKRKFPCKEA